MKPVAGDLLVRRPPGKAMMLHGSTSSHHQNPHWLSQWHPRVRLVRLHQGGATAERDDYFFTSRASSQSTWSPYWPKSEDSTTSTKSWASVTSTLTMLELSSSLER